VTDLRKIRGNPHAQTFFEVCAPSRPNPKSVTVHSFDQQIGHEENLANVAERSPLIHAAMVIG